MRTPEDHPDAARRTLRDLLPELRRYEGFPDADDERILASSLPPHYTACPNPFIREFVASPESDDGYERTPFAADISEGRADPIYRAQMYHTKVPPRAIARYIEHFTPPGGVVFDGFCGSGMTGVAARMTGRRAVLVDLSPAATAIAASYVVPVDADAARSAFAAVLDRLREQCAWLYETADGRAISHVIWSEVYRCPHCATAAPFSDMGFDFATRRPADRIVCPACDREIPPQALERVLTETGTTAERPVRVVRVGERGEGPPTPDDLARLDEVARADIPFWFPDEWMMRRAPAEDGWGDMWRRGYHTGVWRVADFYTPRTLWALAAAVHFARELDAPPAVRHLVTQTIINASINLTRMRRAYQGPVPLVLYFPRLRRECNVIETLERRFAATLAVFRELPADSQVVVSTQSATCLANIPDACIDYIFTDPPFGQNIIYSEVNFLWESWMGITTNQGPEAIMSRSQDKGVGDYEDLMRRCFAEFRRILKPGRWITVEFHNSHNEVWAAIQRALTDAGFVVRDVRVLDKQQLSFKQASCENAVQRDLVISALRPRSAQLQLPSFNAEQQDVWEFVRRRLRELDAADLDAPHERTPRALYTRLVQQRLQAGGQVPLDAAEFYAGLAERFDLRGGHCHPPADAMSTEEPPC